MISLEITVKSLEQRFLNIEVLHHTDLASPYVEDFGAAVAS